MPLLLLLAGYLFAAAPAAGEDLGQQIRLSGHEQAVAHEEFLLMLENLETRRRLGLPPDVKREEDEWSSGAAYKVVHRGPASVPVTGEAPLIDDLRVILIPKHQRSRSPN